MAKTSIRQMVSPQPHPPARFLDVLRWPLRRRRAPSAARRCVPWLVLRTCDDRFYFGLLESGTLYAARFNDDGAGERLPLTYGQGPLTSAYGLASRANIPINIRRAVDRLPVSAINGKAYCGRTHTLPRTHEPAGHMRYRRADHHGQILECTGDNADGTAEPFTWMLFLRCGGPSDGSVSARFVRLSPQLERFLIVYMGVVC